MSSQGIPYSSPSGSGTGDVVGPAIAVNNNFVTFNTTTGKLIKDSGKGLADLVQVGDGSTITGAGTAGDPFVATAGSGDVVGPASATDNAITRYDSTTGKLIQDSGVTIDDAGIITSPDGITAAGMPLVNSGIVDPTKLAITYDATTRTFTTVNTGTKVSVNGIISTPADETTAAHADTTAQYWAYYASGATTLTVATTADIGTSAIAGRAYYNTDQAAAKAISFEEKHSTQWAAKLHENQHQTVGAKFVTAPLGCEIADYTLNTDIDASKQFSLTAGEMYDEDIEHTITALSTGGYSIAYRAGLDSADRMDWDDSATSPFKMSGTYLDYNELNGGTWGQTELTSNDRVNYFVFAWTRSDNTRDIVIFQGQQVHSSLDAAQGEEPGDIQLPSYLAPE